MMFERTTTGRVQEEEDFAGRNPKTPLNDTVSGDEMQFREPPAPGGQK
jgi:hypothetical protein